MYTYPYSIVFLQHFPISSTLCSAYCTKMKFSNLELSFHDCSHYINGTPCIFLTIITTLVTKSLSVKTNQPLDRRSEEKGHALLTFFILLRRPNFPFQLFSLSHTTHFKQNRLVCAQVQKQKYLKVGNFCKLFFFSSLKYKVKTITSGL